LVRYKTGAESPEGAAGRIAIVDGRGGRLRTVALTGGVRPVDESGWREAEVEFLLDREQSVGVWVQVPPGCAVTIDYVDIQAKGEKR